MTTIGYATLQIIPSLTGVSDSIHKQTAGISIGVDVSADKDAARRSGQQAGKALADGAEEATTRARRVGDRLGSAISTGLKGAAIGAIGGIAATLASTLGAGFDRLKSIDATKAKLEGLGHSAESVTQIMESATLAVKGTAFSLGEAGTVAASAVAAGVKPGIELERTLKLVADASSVAGISMGDMGSIFNKIAAGGVIQGEELAQLGDRGIPILQLLSEQLGVSVQDVRKLAADGKVSFADFQNSIEKGMGGAALKAGGSFQGSMDNVRAAMGRLGATVLQPLFNAMIAVAPRLQAALDKITSGIGAAADFVSEHSTSFKLLATAITAFVVPALTLWISAQARAVAASAVGAISSMATAWTTVAGALRLSTIAQVAQSAAAKTAAAAQWILNAALSANPIGLIVTAIAALVGGLVLFFTKTELGRKIWAGFTEYLKVAWEAIKVAFGAAWDAISGIWDGMVTGAKLVWDGVKNQFSAVVDFVAGLPSAIAGAAKGMWDGVSNAFGAMIDKLKAWWNGFASALSFTSPDWLPGDPVTFALPKFATGGYTGDMAADTVAGVVHGGEYVIRKSSTTGIQNAYPGLLDYLNSNGALPGYASGGLVAGTAELGKIISQKFGISNIGGWRPADKYGEHSTGRALDVMTSDKATGDAVKDFAVANASAIDLKWAIWQQRMWYPGGTSKAMEDRGNPTQNHMDHVHIFSGAGIVAGLRGALKGDQADASAKGPGNPTYEAGGALDVMAPITGPTAAAGGSSASGGFSISMGDSFSGMAGMAGEQLGRISPVVSPDGKQESLDKLGSAVGQVAAGQVSSAMGAFGINDSPGWLKGLSTLANGMSFGGGAGASAAPLASATNIIPAGTSAATSAAASAVHGGGAKPGPQVTYNIRTATVEDAALVMQRREKERAAATLARF